VWQRWVRLRVPVQGTTNDERKEKQMAGEFVHIEIPAADTQKSREFYGLLFGWKYQENPGPFDYYMAQIGDRQGAAITNMEPGKRGSRN
jgi:predicted enzyme related to lactoylglutathione lyase